MSIPHRYASINKRSYISTRRLSAMAMLLFTTTVCFAQKEDSLQDAETKSNVSVGSSASSPLPGGERPGDSSSNVFIKKPDPTGRLETIYSSSSDTIQQREDKIGFANPVEQQRLKHYSGEVLRMKSVAEWIDLTVYKFVFSSDVATSPTFRISSSVGVGQLTLDRFLGRTFGTSKTLPLWRVRATWTPQPRTDIRLEGNADYSFVGWLDRWDRSQVMAMRNLWLEVESSAIEKWQFRSNARVAFFDDTNQQLIVDNLIFREVMVSPFFLRIGAAGGWTEFRDRGVGYWSPIHFESYGARVELAKDLFRGVRLEYRLHTGLHQERGFRRERDTAGEFKLIYHDPNGWFLRATANFLASEGGGWWRRDFGLNFEMPI